MLEIVRPGDRHYAAVRDVYTATGRPAAVARPSSTAEVVEALRLAREAGGPLSVRSGGHGISSIATNAGGTVVDLSRLNAVERLDGNMVRVGPGARWGDVAAALHPWGLAISSGDSGDVGVGGLATTGGIGLMGRAHGLTIDHLVAAELVTADGMVRRIDADHDPELFWAVRGAGANIGIATSFEFRADPVPVVGHATLQYRVDDLPRFLRDWGETVESAPRSVSAFLYLMGTEFALATVVYAGDDAELAGRAFGPFTAVAPVLGQRAQLVPYAGVVAATHAPHRGQQGASTHTGLAVHLDGPVTAGLADLAATGTTDMLQIRSTGGAVNDVPEDATAYAHRHQNFSVTAISGAGGPPFDEAWDRVRPSMDGLYLSFETSFSPSLLEAAFPPATLNRLRDIKRTVDPDGVFNQNFPVGLPSESSGAEGRGVPHRSGTPASATASTSV
ncbi:FAD-binding protein [Paractinoplanes deccanensis]|uniref:FAD-binding protein n=1 Tax=Paractinoplanes deccanensis TaxID=113561 RepID=A0ABQ3Y3V2_9ACTN|nr:FAD-binding oxidoreductase [Actinoplanes deccanensis]GID74669.1 FAD-binding protein [Actinoplanes deccanensis]